MNPFAINLKTFVILSVYSYTGEALRSFTEQLFGQACHKPGTVGWASSGWTPCTTAPGTTAATGGALFIDLPANLLGCFIMGILVSGDIHLGTAVDAPIAMLPRNHWFQSFKVTHAGIRTGFCGSLTTFASWNTQMIQMLMGGDKEATAIGHSQWVSVLFGYIVGLYVSLEAFRWGRDCAMLLHRWTNPDLAREEDQIVDRKEIGVLVDRDLPDFERRFLNDLEVDENDRKEQHASHLHHLQEWKDQTDAHRNHRGTSGRSFSKELKEIEHSILTEGEDPSVELKESADVAGWNVDALLSWKRASQSPTALQEIEIDENEAFEAEMEQMAKTEEVEGERTSLFRHFKPESHVHMMVWIVVTSFLLWGTITLNSPEADVVTYRSTLLATLLAPFGTYGRWLLSKLNGTVKHHNWEWLPLGTFVANMLASCISVIAVGINFRFASTDLQRVWLVGIKSGFAGALSTVSTFATETTRLWRAFPRHAWGFYYSIGTLSCATCLGLMCYFWFIVF